MVRFADGPAKLSELNLRRTPVFLRVVIDWKGKVDALDMPEDVPAESEKVYAYRIIEGTQTSGFLCGRSRGSGCTVFRSAIYKLCDTQPEDDILRDREKWTQWTRDQNEKINSKNRLLCRDCIPVESIYKNMGLGNCVCCGKSNVGLCKVIERPKQ